MSKKERVGEPLAKFKTACPECKHSFPFYVNWENIKDAYKKLKRARKRRKLPT